MSTPDFEKMALALYDLIVERGWSNVGRKTFAEYSAGALQAAFDIGKDSGWNAAIEEAAGVAMNTQGHAVADCCRESIAEAIRTLKAATP